MKRRMLTQVPRNREQRRGETCVIPPLISSFFSLYEHTTHTRTHARTQYLGEDLEDDWVVALVVNDHAAHGAEEASGDGLGGRGSLLCEGKEGKGHERSLCVSE